MGDSVYRVTEVIGVERRVVGGGGSNAVQTAAAAPFVTCAWPRWCGRTCDRERAGVRLPGAAGDLVQVRVGRLILQHLAAPTTTVD